MEQAEADWRFPWWWWGLVAGPLIVFAGANYILAKWGMAQFQLAQPLVADGHAEASARLRTFSAFLAFVALAVAAIAYAADNVRRLPRPRRQELIHAYWITLLVGVLLMLALGLHRGDAYLEDKLPCASFELLTRQEASGKDPAAPPDAAARPETAPTPASKKSPAKVPTQQTAQAKPADAALEKAAATAGGDAGAGPGRPPRIATDKLECDLPEGWLGLPAFRKDQSNGLRQLRIMFTISALFLVLATPAVLWGAVACLALPTGGSRRDRYEAWAGQTARLNRLLYVTAGFLVAGLFFSSTRWTWPGYSLHPDDAAPYAEHVRSLVAYVGVLNTLLIASYYVPVAARLAASSPPAPFAAARAATAGGEAAKPDPFGAYARALAILSPAILGFVAELVKFSP